jgi:thiopeptide-type bacteriocin biosynthesis protein
MRADDELLKYWNELREARKISLWFSVSSTDNELVVYSKNADSLRLFVEEIAHSNSVIISEYLMDEFQAVEQKGSFFSNEVLFFFKKDQEQNTGSGSQIPQHQPDNNIQRDFGIGDHWMYYKIYLGFRQTETALLYLRDAIHPLIKKGYIRKFFFIRYKDPKFHVRLRIYAESKYHARILKILNNAFSALKERLGYIKIIQDSYLREIERYGAEYIEAAETIFYLDSEIVIGILRILLEGSSDQRDKQRWFSALYLAKKYLYTIFSEVDDLCKYTELNWKAHADQLRVTKESIRAIDQDFNENRLQYMDLLNENLILQTDEIRGIKDWIDQQFIEIQKVIKGNGIPQTIMGSIIHMSLNRLFRSHNNTYEFSVYQILKRYFFTIKNKK